MAADRPQERLLVITRTPAGFVDQIQSAKRSLRQVRRDLSEISKWVDIGDIPTNVDLSALSIRLVGVIQELHTLQIDVQATEGVAGQQLALEEGQNER